MKTFVGVAVLSAVVSFATVLVLHSTGTLNGLGIGTNTGPGGNGGGPVILEGDDDRPPVVVSGGSVIIEQQVDAKDQIRGDFEVIATGNLKRWRAKHDKNGNGHGGGSNPKGLTVIIDNSTTNLPGCKPTVVHTKIMLLTFSYTAQNGTTRDFTAKIDAAEEELQFDLVEDAEQLTASKFRLKIPGATLTAVKVGANEPCALGAYGRVEMRQRK